MKKELILLCALALAGCSHYEKSGVSAKQEAADEAACKYEATKATANDGSGVDYANVLMQCMQLKGYNLYSN